MNTDRFGYFAKAQIGNALREFYREQGFLVVHDAVSQVELDELIAQTVAICRGQCGQVISAADAAFLTPEQARGLSDEEVMKRLLCIHHPHKISPVVHRLLAQPAIVEVLKQIIGPDVKCMQSMLFLKAAGKPGQAWHQDEDYIPTRDRSLAGAWIAVGDATVENGCLWVIPGSHKSGVLWPQYPHKDARYDCAEMSFDFPYSERDAVPVEVPAGAVVFFNGYLLHKSEPNYRSTGFRRALVNHYMSAQSLLPWRVQEGLGTAKFDFRDIVMVAGTDPYAWKGIEDLSKPHIRRAGEGGCGDGRVELETYKAKREQDRTLVYR